MTDESGSLFQYNQCLGKALKVSYKLNKENYIQARSNVFLEYHSDKLTANFAGHGLAHYDSVVRSFTIAYD